MSTGAKCICCKEITRVVAKMSEANDTAVTCITGHPGFEGMCLNVWVLQAAYFQYRQEHGSSSLPPLLHEYVCSICNIHYLLYSTFLCCRKYKYIAYQQLTRWCWGWLGQNIRVILPACAVKKIRDTFPSDSYTGFKFPTLH